MSCRCIMMPSLLLDESLLFPGVVDVFNAYAEHFHVAEEFGQFLLHELLLALIHDLLLGTWRHKIAQSALVVYDAVARQFIVCLHSRIGVYLQCHGIFSHRWYAQALYRKG